MTYLGKSTHTMEMTKEETKSKCIFGTYIGGNYIVYGEW